jgi:hypothetical protein
MLAVYMDLGKSSAQPIVDRARCSSAGVSGTGPQIRSKTRSFANVIT